MMLINQRGDQHLPKEITGGHSKELDAPKVDNPSNAPFCGLGFTQNRCVSLGYQNTGVSKTGSAKTIDTSIACASVGTL